MNTSLQTLEPQWSPLASNSRAGIIQRACACGNHTIGGGECSGCKKRRGLEVQRSPSSNTSVASAPPIVDEVLRSPGVPLDRQTRNFFESRFGGNLSRVQTRSIARAQQSGPLTIGEPHDPFEREADAMADRVTRMPASSGGNFYDFSDVRIHADARAAESARSVNALAYTVGKDLVFATGRYAPQTDDGLRLIAHELTHVVQQSGSNTSKGLNSQAQLQRQTESSDEPENSVSEPENAGENGPATEEPSGESGAPEPTTDQQPNLAALTAQVDELAYTVRRVNRDQGALPGRTTEVGSTTCNPDTGQPEWRIDRSRIPQCMWACAERHEQTHAEFMRMPCETVWLPIERARFWIRRAGQYAEQGNLQDAERAARQAEAAVEEGRRAVQWYQMYMAQTCRYDEGTAYQEGIEVCDTREVRSRCTATGELSQYNIQMAAWRRFSQNPPNCPPQPPPPPRRP